MPKTTTGLSPAALPADSGRCSLASTNTANTLATQLTSQPTPQHQTPHSSPTATVKGQQPLQCIAARLLQSKLLQAAQTSHLYATQHTPSSCRTQNIETHPHSLTRSHSATSAHSPAHSPGRPLSHAQPTQQRWMPSPQERWKEKGIPVPVHTLLHTWLVYCQTTAAH